jgi:transposase-like protein
MQRRSFSREFKVEAVRLVRERSVSVAQAARDLDVHENVLRKGSSSLRTTRWRRSLVVAG